MSSISILWFCSQRTLVISHRISSRYILWVVIVLRRWSVIRIIILIPCSGFSRDHVTYFYMWFYHTHVIIWVSLPTLFIYLSVCLQHYSKMNYPKVLELAREWPWDILEVIWFWGWKVKGQGHMVNKCIFHTTTVFHRHSLGGETSRPRLHKCLQLHFIDIH